MPVQERADLEDFRYRRALALGFSVIEAELICTLDWTVFDLHDVEKWLSQGATHHQVLRILA